MVLRHYLWIEIKFDFWRLSFGEREQSGGTHEILEWRTRREQRAPTLPLLPFCTIFLPGHESASESDVPGISRPFQSKDEGESAYVAG